MSCSSHRSTGAAGIIAAALLLMTLSHGSAIAATAPPPPSAGPSSIARLGGADRYATSALISASAFDAGVPVAYVANGTDWPDALAAGPAAAAQGGPVLLITQSAVPAMVAAELVRLHPARIVAVGSTAMISAAGLAALHAYAPVVTRIGGADPYMSSALISADVFPPDVPVAFVDNGSDWPDGVSAGPLAAEDGGPLLYVGLRTIPATVASELRRLRPARIVAVGSVGVVSDALLGLLRGYAQLVTRIGGPDRYATSALISASASRPGLAAVYIDNGSDWPDAVSAAPAAARLGAPILLVGQASVPSTIGTELARLHPGRVIALGGPHVLSDRALFTAAGRPDAITSYHVPVLMYHRVAPASERGHDLADLVLEPARFDAQLAALKASGWHTMTSGQLAAAMGAGVAVPPMTFVISIDDGRDDGYIHAFPILQKYGFVATFFVITGRADAAPYLTWAEMRTMVAAGDEIGNHSVSHLDFSQYTRAQTDAQVLGAQAAIEANVGAVPVSFAYPFGAAYPDLVASVQAAGLSVAYTTVEGAAETLGTALLLPRMRVHDTTMPAQLLGLLAPYH